MTGVGDKCGLRILETIILVTERAPVFKNCVGQKTPKISPRSKLCQQYPKTVTKMKSSTPCRQQHQSSVNFAKIYLSFEKFKKIKNSAENSVKTISWDCNLTSVVIVIGCE